jgi:hypothetical protein
VTEIPSRVIDSVHGVDPIEKCMWILEQRFSCRRFGSLNVDQFRSPEKVVAALSLIQLPMILSVVGKNSLYNHVVVVWKSHIIDFECRTTYSVSEANVNRICGTNNTFVKIARGYVILPSKKMKYAVKDFSDWGEKQLREKYYYLFMSRKK